MILTKQNKTKKKPCPKGPVVTSIPSVKCDSGWPGVLDKNKSDDE